MTVQVEAVAFDAVPRAECWHCNGMGICACISCAVGGCGELEPGPCVACNARSNSVSELEPEPASEVVFSPEKKGERKRRKLLVEPEWEYYRDPRTGRLSFRAEVARLLWDCGLQQKAIRFLNCNKCGRPGVCSRYPFEHKFFIPHGCEVIFCKECADELRRRLLVDYWHVVCNAVLDFAGERQEHERLCGLLENSAGLERKSIERQLGELWGRVGRRFREKGWVLARINFTLRSDGSSITPERVKKFNRCVGTAMRLIVGRFEATDVRNSSRCALQGKIAELGVCEDYGMLFVDEVGFEKRGHLPDAQRVAHGLNLHCHGLYFGPWKICRENWERVRDLWIEVTKREFGVESRGFYIKAIRNFAVNPGRTIRWALHHMLKYVSKPPAVTEERLASLIAAFNTTRRVHSLGLFYGKKPKREKKDCPCPKCRAMGLVSTVSFEGTPLPDGGCVPRFTLIEELIADGYVSLREAGREAVLAMGASREDSWGASP